MEMSLNTVILFNFVEIFLIIIFGTRLIIKGIENIIHEQTLHEYTDEDRFYSNEMFMEQVGIVRRKFFVSFYIVELSLILYFIFWGMMFYYQVKII